MLCDHGEGFGNILALSWAFSLVLSGRSSQCVPISSSMCGGQSLFSFTLALIVKQDMLASCVCYVTPPYVCV